MTRDHVIQVSDRRLGHIIDDKYVPGDDYANKAVVYRKQVSFSFSGIGKINGLGIDKWLGDILYDKQPKTIKEGFSIVSREATELFKKFRLPIKDKRHSFVVIGWGTKGKIKRLRPFTAIISNAQNDKGRWLPEASDRFRERVLFLSKTRTVHIIATGQRLILTQTQPTDNLDKQSDDEIQELELNVQGLLKKNSGVLPVADLLVRKIMQAASYNCAIGSNLMVVSLPRKFFSAATSAFSRSTFWNHPPNEDSPSFFYVGEDMEMVQFSPILVEAGSKGSFEARFGKDAADSLLKKMTIPDALLEWTIVFSNIVNATNYGPFGESASILEIIKDCPGTHHTYISAPQPEPSEYPPPLIGIKAERDIISRIKKDDKYFVVSEPDNADSVPDSDWFFSLRNWLSSTDLNPHFLDRFLSEINGMTRRAIIGKLEPILKTPKNKLI